MPKQKGSLKTGGRAKGTPNKRTAVLQSITESLGFDIPRRISELLPQLDPPKQADVLLDLMGYLYPKRKAIEHSGPDGGPIEVHSQHRDRLKQILSDPTALAAAEVLEQKLGGITYEPLPD